MSQHADPQRKLLHDVMRFKRERNLALEHLRRQANVLDGLRADAIAFRLTGRLRMEDFVAFIGVQKVLAADGGIDGRRLEGEVVDLLRRRPELAVSPVSEVEVL